ncbi:MAG: DUF697 domain-containing protein [Cyanothece sp. SIO2G6]|nr:DUF697 domain-containing protein [Cyanothece sp. SIO2G6]
MGYDRKAMDYEDTSMVAKRWASVTPNVLLKKPFLVGGLGLTLGVSFWDLAMPDSVDLLSVATWGAIALGAGAWWWSRQDVTLDLSSPPLPAVIDRTAVESALAKANQSIEQFTTEAQTTAQAASQGASQDASKVGNYEAAIARLQQRYQELTQAHNRRSLRCAVVGSKGVGKTALVDQLSACIWEIQNIDESSITLSFDDTAALLTPDASASSSTTELLELQSTDLVFFVTEGDITASELQVIHSLLDQRFEVVVVFNKHDRHLPETRQTILKQLQGRLCPPLDRAAIVSTSAIATAIKVRQHQPDGTVQERIDQNPVQLAALTDRVQQLLNQGVESLVLPTTLRQVHQFQRDIQHQWNHLRRDRARPILEKYQWIAAATAFANPLPTFDLVATGAINAQLLADLGQLYNQPFSLSQAKVATGTLAELMVKLGLVELTTQAVAPLLKTHTLTFAAGGAIQGISAAYLTHVASLSVIQYLEERCVAQAVGSDRQTQVATDASWNLDRLGQIMQQVFQTYQRGDFLQTLVDQGIKRFTERLGGKTRTVAASR